MDRDAQLIERMTDALIDHDVDLGDEAAVIKLLSNLTFSLKDINRLMSAAINGAREYRAHCNVLQVA